MSLKRLAALALHHQLALRRYVPLKRQIERSEVRDAILMVKGGATLIFGHCVVGVPGVMLWTKLPAYVPSKKVVVLGGDPGAAATAGGGG